MGIISLLQAWSPLLVIVGTVSGIASGFWYSQKHAKVETRHASIEERESLIKEATYWRDQVAYWRKDSATCHSALHRATDLSAQIMEFLEKTGSPP